MRGHKRTRNSRRNEPCHNTKHHRRPVSLGGKNVKSNISVVPRFKHEAWHLLFDNFPVLKILGLLQEYYEVFGVGNKSEAQKRRNNEWIRSRPGRIKKQFAWRNLFHKLSLEEIVNEINATWLDPEYEFIVWTEKNEKIAVIAK